MDQSRRLRRTGQQYRNLGRNTLRGPGWWQTGAGLSKMTHLIERTSLDFRAEAFNLFNVAHTRQFQRHRLRQFAPVPIHAPARSLIERMTPQQKAESLGLEFKKQAPGYLNLCIRSGNQLITSGHVSDTKGKLGAGLSTEQGRAAARECAVKVLRSVWDAHGTLDGLRVLKVLGCVNSAPDFIEQHLVINGCSDLFHEIFGKDGDGFHARSALGFASLPTGVAVEVEAIFELK